jgi:hypothetical protein
VGWGFLGLGGLGAFVTSSVMASDSAKPTSDAALFGMVSGSIASLALGGLLLWVSEDEVTVDIKPDA